jgi:hypothetical protein
MVDKAIKNESGQVNIMVIITHGQEKKILVRRYMIKDLSGATRRKATLVKKLTYMNNLVIKKLEFKEY